MPSWFYFVRASNLAFHDLTTKLSPPKNLRSLLGLGLKFCPIPRKAKFDPSTLLRFTRDINLRTFFAGKIMEQKEEYEPKMYINSAWKPNPWDIPHSVTRRTRNFSKAITHALQPKASGRSNLLWTQQIALKALQKQEEFLVVSCDKNLGPAIIEKSIYIQRAYKDHLSDSATYRELTPTKAEDKMNDVKIQLLTWKTKYKDDISPMQHKFLITNLEQCKDPFPTFYLTIKIHKTPWKTRPIVSCSGSLLYALGVWVDRKLQVVARYQHSYISSSKKLKDLIIPLDLPPNAQLFTADAVSMYTNINTRHALRIIGDYLQRNSQKFPSVPYEAVMVALSLIMTNNIFRFGDTYWHQLEGTAMGTPPAVPYATLFYAIREAQFVHTSPNLYFYRRYIDDVFAIWIPSDTESEDSEKWAQLQHAMNDHYGLKWTFSDRIRKVDFLDITISIDDTRICTTLFEKLLNLYLFIPPHSAHPPGVLNGLVLGNCHRIYTLCSDPTDIAQHLRRFYKRLKARGYKSEDLLPKFTRAHELALTPKLPKPPASMDSTRIFLHLEYHPYSPPSFQLQELWKRHVFHPPFEKELTAVQNIDSNELEIEKMIIAYSRPRNLGNLLSYRNLQISKGPPVSSMLPHRLQTREGPERERERERERVIFGLRPSVVFPP